jgi:protoheme IX farnesyltransferase
MKRKPPKADTLFKAYIELTKPSITFMILISTALGYYMGGGGVHDPLRFFLTLIGSGLVSSGAGALNHYIEQDTDRLMDRTKSRPIPTGMISPNAAVVFGIVLTLIGEATLLYFINLFTAILAFITSILYLFIYTPLKKRTWLNTTIGAIPGAIPPLGGWLAVKNTLEPEAWILFAILFLWQHPHFYAIAFMCKNDYSKANLQMLPVLEKDGRRTNRQILWHSLLLIPVSVMPSYIGLLGMTYFWGAFVLGIIYFFSGFPLIKNYSLNNARLLLKVSVIYLPALFVMIIIDKIV